MQFKLSPAGMDHFVSTRLPLDGNLGYAAEQKAKELQRTDHL